MCVGGSPAGLVRHVVHAVSDLSRGGRPPFGRGLGPIDYAYVTVTYATVASKRREVPAFRRTPALPCRCESSLARGGGSAAHRRRAVCTADRRTARRAGAHCCPLAPWL